MNWHLWNEALVMYFVLATGTRAVDPLHFCVLIDLFHPFNSTSEQFYLLYCLFAIMDEKGHQ